jgi:hypothetical protein
VQTTRRTRKSVIATTLGLALSAAVLLDACTSGSRASSAGTPTAAASSIARPTSSIAGPSSAAPIGSSTTATNAGVPGSSAPGTKPAAPAAPAAKPAAPALPVSAPRPRPVRPKAVLPPAPVVARPGGEPGPGNTGVPPGTHLTVVNGDVNVTTNGQVIDSADIKGELVINASNVVVRRSLVEGRHGQNSVVVQSGSGIVFEDDEIAVVSPSAASDDMHVSGATLNRLNIHGGVDGIKLGQNSIVEASWIHGLSAFASDPVQGGGATHNDAIQIMGGTNIQVIGNNLQAATQNNAALQVTQDVSRVSGLVVSRNWADGGGCTFNISGHGPGGKLLAMSGITLTANRFGHASQFACPVLIDKQTTFVQSGNVYNDTGQAVAIKIHN